MPTAKITVPASPSGAEPVGDPGADAADPHHDAGEHEQHQARPVHPDVHGVQRDEGQEPGHPQDAGEHHQTGQQAGPVHETVPG
jgi:hypothetical protein